VLLFSNDIDGNRPSIPLVNIINKLLANLDCKLVPFFGIFLKDLYATFKHTPSLLVIHHEKQKTTEVSKVCLKSIFNE